MAKLKLDITPEMGRMQTVKISGFKNGELNELKSMDHYEAKEKIIDMLDMRNDGLGTCWMCGPGVYGLWFDNEAAYLRVGTGCD